MINARALLLCLVAFCCSAAFADIHPASGPARQLSRTYSQARARCRTRCNHRAISRARSSHCSLRIFCLRISPSPHRALLSAEPFDLPATLVPTEEISANGASFSSAFLPTRRRSRLALKQKHVLAGRTPLFVDLKLGRKHEGRARLDGSIERSTWVSSQLAIGLNMVMTILGITASNARQWAGDCEDYAIVKYVALRELGISADDLRVVIVQDDKRLTDHTVVAVRSERKWLILDNRTMAILNTEDARNYRPCSR